jgi:protein-S-isoprenylcysteine O-methyltransferase Ste14
VSPLFASIVILDLWVVSWIVAAVWSRRTAARPPFLESVTYLVPTFIGAAMFAWGAEARFGIRGWVAAQPLWRLPGPVDWGMTALVLAGLAFAWWARLTLGSLWSGTVTRKEGHVLMRTGPYRFVRHPIYTGLILALAAIAVQIGMAASLIGVVVLTFGFWLKARLEERFLIAAVGEAAYADFRRATPMLIPFWPTRG